MNVLNAYLAFGALYTGFFIFYYRKEILEEVAKMPAPDSVIKIAFMITCIFSVVCWPGFVLSAILPDSEGDV